MTIDQIILLNNAKSLMIGLRVFIGILMLYPLITFLYITFNTKYYKDETVYLLSTLSKIIGGALFGLMIATIGMGMIFCIIGCFINILLCFHIAYNMDQRL